MINLLGDDALMLKEFVENQPSICRMDKDVYSTLLSMTFWNFTAVLRETIRFANERGKEELLDHWAATGRAIMGLSHARTSLPENRPLASHELSGEREILREVLVAAMETLQRLTPDPDTHRAAGKIYTALVVPSGHA